MPDSNFNGSLKVLSVCHMMGEQKDGMVLVDRYSLILMLLNLMLNAD